MKPFTKAQKEAARELAVRYNAFGNACHADDANGIVVWGELLLETQEATGVEVADPVTTRRMIGHARRREAERAEREQAQAA